MHLNFENICFWIVWTFLWICLVETAGALARGEVGSPRFYCWWPHGCWMCFMILEWVSHLKIWINAWGQGCFHGNPWGRGGVNFPYFGTNGYWGPLMDINTAKASLPVWLYEYSKMGAPSLRTLFKRGEPHPFHNRSGDLANKVLAQKPNRVNR